MSFMMNRLFVFCLIVLAGCAIEPVSSVEALPKDTVPIYAGPHVRDYKVLGEIGPGDRITLVGRGSNSWVAFEYGGNLAWVQDFLLDIDGNHRRLAEVEPRAVVQVGVSEPSTSSGSTTQAGISWRDAGAHLGEYTTICGPIVSAHFASSSNGQPTFLNMGEDFQSNQRFVVLIWGEDRNKFPSRPEDFYSGQDICVTGEIEVYQGVYEIEVSSPLSIDVD